jgi:uncharacterized membrane-anchored protein
MKCVNGHSFDDSGSNCPDCAYEAGYRDGAAEKVKAVQEERAHCLRLIEAPLPGLEMLGSAMAKQHIVALREAATAVRESGTFRDAMAAKKAANPSSSGA